jgi:hypothetical protein
MPARLRQSLIGRRIGFVQSLTRGVARLRRGGPLDRSWTINEGDWHLVAYASKTVDGEITRR